jgi:hypothetical protein
MGHEGRRGEANLGGRFQAGILLASTDHRACEAYLVIRNGVNCSIRVNGNSHHPKISILPPSS